MKKGKSVKMGVKIYNQLSLIDGNKISIEQLPCISIALIICDHSDKSNLRIMKQFFHT